MVQSPSLKDLVTTLYRPRETIAALAARRLAEAQRFSTQKGFTNVAIALALPLLVFFAAVFTFGR